MKMRIPQSYNRSEHEKKYEIKDSAQSNPIQPQSRLRSVSLMNYRNNTSRVARTKLPKLKTQNSQPQRQASKTSKNSRFPRYRSALSKTKTKSRTKTQNTKHKASANVHPKNNISNKQKNSALQTPMNPLKVNPKTSHKTLHTP
jgi:hypothetical protein